MIVGNKVVGAYNTINEAYYRGKDKYGLGNFLVLLCTPGDSAYTVTYRTRVSRITGTGSSGSLKNLYPCPYSLEYKVINILNVSLLAFLNSLGVKPQLL